MNVFTKLYKKGHPGHRVTKMGDNENMGRDLRSNLDGSWSIYQMLILFYRTSKKVVYSESEMTEEVKRNLSYNSESAIILGYLYKL